MVCPGCLCCDGYGNEVDSSMGVGFISPPLIGISSIIHHMWVAFLCNDVSLGLMLFVS